MSILGVASLVGTIGMGLFGNQGHKVPASLIRDLEQRAKSNRTEGFIPDRGAFDANLQAQLDEMIASLGVGKEDFNADLAARGIYSSGEAPKRMYSDVYAPIARAGASAVASANVDFERMAQQGAFRKAEAENARWAQLLQAYGVRSSSAAQAPDYLGDLFGLGSSIQIADWMG